MKSMRKTMSAMVAVRAARRYRRAVMTLSREPHRALGDDVVGTPWIAVLYYDAPAYDRWDYRTAIGVVVDSDWVLTVAHAFGELPLAPYDVPGQGKTSFRVRVGGRRFGEGAIRDVEKIVAHPDFDGRLNCGGTHDIAMLKLADSVDSPPIAIADESPEVGDDVSFFGWPRDVPVGEPVFQGNTSVITPQAAMPGRIGPGDLCGANLALPNAARIGFSGGPVVENVDDKPALVGIVSRAAIVKSATHGMPLIFTDVVAHRDFIRDVSSGAITAADGKLDHLREREMRRQ